MHGFEPVARVGQRPVHDGGERIGEIALFERLAQRDILLDVARFRGNHLFIHGANGLARLAFVNKNGRNQSARAHPATAARAAQNAWRSRKKPVSAKASATSAAEAGAFSARRKAGSRMQLVAVSLRPPRATPRARTAATHR